MAELTGQKAPATDGISFLPELFGEGKEQEEHQCLYFEYPEKGGQVAVRLGDWKGVKTNMKKDPKAPWQLFNLKNDRNETTDVAAQHPDMLKKLDAIVKKEHQHIQPKEWEFVDATFTIVNTTQKNKSKK
jgi:arylsulfatase A-like enzyme